jgi:hypothetical protein
MWTDRQRRDPASDRAADWRKRGHRARACRTEFEYFVPGPAPSPQQAKTKRSGQTVPVGIDRDRAHTGGHVVSRAASSAPVWSA